MTPAMRLLDWYDRHHRSLPWRVAPADGKAGKRPDPYHVWLSEVMLQQTTVAAVKDYFSKFVTRWPTVRDLAEASNDEVMSAWAGLGYYARARNLKACAETVAFTLDGQFPQTVEGLKALPGIGDYTSAAIAAIAFQVPATVVDGNVERVITRLHAIDTVLPAARPDIRRLTEIMTDRTRPGDFAQAMMDLGATLCTPRSPACAICPLREDCAAFAAGEPERYPVKPAKTRKPVRVGAAFVARAEDGSIFLRRRPERGLLGGMTEVPTTDWTASRDGGTEASHAAEAGAPAAKDWRRAGSVVHVFTHFELQLVVYRADVTKVMHNHGWWCAREKLDDEALPTVMRKVVDIAFADEPNAAPRNRKRT